MPTSDGCLGAPGLATSHMGSCRRGQIRIYYDGFLSNLQGNDAEVPTAELDVVAAWYIWWQRRQIVKGVKVQTPEKTALAIKVLATNYLRSTIPQ